MSGISTTTTMPDWAKDIPVSTRGIRIFGYVSALLFTSIFVLWAGFAPLRAAIVASGMVAASGKNVDVQHLEGGIIQEVFIEEGDFVRAGEQLIQLDNTTALSNRTRLNKQWISLSLRTELLRAGRDNLDILQFSPAIVAEAEQESLQDVVAEQLGEFAARRARQNSEEIILHQRVEVMRERIVGLEAQIGALETQLELLIDETEIKRSLLDLGLAQRQDHVDLLLKQAELQGELGSVTADIATVESQIIEASEQRVALNSTRVETAIVELNGVLTQLADIGEQLTVADEALSRATILAPTEGVVVQIYRTTPGSVVGPGERLVEILPTSSDLLVFVQLSPSDVDEVRLGQEVNLRFSALNARITPEVSGRLRYVSADQLTDAGTNRAYFEAHVEISGILPVGITHDQIYAGMPVEVFIVTGARTFFSYLSKPIVDSFARAFKE